MSAIRSGQLTAVASHPGSPDTQPLATLQLPWQGTYLYYLKDLTSHQLKGVVPLEHAKVEAAKDQTSASRHLIKIWVSNTFVRVVQQRRYVLSAPTVQIQVQPCLPDAPASPAC